MSEMHRHDCRVSITTLKNLEDILDNAQLDRCVLSELTDQQLAQLSLEVHEVILLLKEFVDGNENEPGY